jgi:hypothetical protein
MRRVAVAALKFPVHIHERAPSGALFVGSTAKARSARVEFSSDLRFPVQTSSWTTRGLEQSVLPGDEDHAVMEVTAPSPTRGFFRLIYSP